MNKNLMVLAVAGALTAPGLAVAQIPGPGPSPAILRAPGGAEAITSPGVTIAGRIDSMIMNNAYSEDFANRLAPTTGGRSKVTKGDLYQAGNTMFIRAREDLGGGTNVHVQLGIGVWQERLDTSIVTGNNWGGQNSDIGFTSGLGDIAWGIWDSPYKQTAGTWNLISSSGLAANGIIVMNGDATGTLPNALCANTVANASGAVGAALPAVNSCSSEASAATTAFSRRTSNSINYRTPVISGFQARVQTALANYQSPSTTANSGNVAGGQLQQPKFWSLGAQWARGPFEIAVGYDMHTAFREANTSGTLTAGATLAGTANAAAKDTGVQLGVRYDFGMGVVGVGLEKLSYGALDNGAFAIGGNNRNLSKMDVTNMAVNGRLNAGPGQVFVGYSSTPGGKGCVAQNAAGTVAGTTIGSASCDSFGKATMVTLGYDYILSKRTKIYVAFNKIDNGNGTNYYYIAGPAGNNSNGTASGIAAGTDVTTWGLGAQHTF